MKRHSSEELQLNTSQPGELAWTFAFVNPDTLTLANGPPASTS